ncbi:hypothetical protein [Streptomyces sp. Cmuel-A718b]|uniref:hypothetical protein n=1 Tax=Streptomyces sp. Cmuel-A718b TaxID=697328 RepID=UPI00114C8725|nr:hypothetical protein [Streptomyces sp. Cmuel-A718b]
MSELEAEHRAHYQATVVQEALRTAAADGDPYASILLVPDDPYPLYEQLRERGTLHRSAVGVWTTTSHRLANQILRDRRFGVRTPKARNPPSSCRSTTRCSDWTRPTTHGCASSPPPR